MGLISSSKMDIEKLEDGYIAFFSINSVSLDNEEKSLLKDIMVGYFDKDIYKCYIADNNERPIIFENEKAAYGTLVKEGSSLIKKFQFSLFSEKGVMVSPPKVSVVSFVPKK